MNEYDHRCTNMDDDIRITARVEQKNRDSGNPRTGRTYWIMEWGYEDGNDPCYGTLEVQYCPCCGKKL